MLFLSEARLILRWGTNGYPGVRISEPRPSPALQQRQRCTFTVIYIRVAVVCVVVCSLVVGAERVLYFFRIRGVGAVGLVSVEISLSWSCLCSCSSALTHSLPHLCRIRIGIGGRLAGETSQCDDVSHLLVTAVRDTAGRRAQESVLSAACWALPRYLFVALLPVLIQCFQKPSKPASPQRTGLLVFGVSRVGLAAAPDPSLAFADRVQDNASITYSAFSGTLTQDRATCTYLPTWNRSDCFSPTALPQRNIIGVITIALWIIPIAHTSTTVYYGRDR